MKTYVMTPHENCLSEEVLLKGHKICFNGYIWLIIPESYLLPHLIWITVITAMTIFRIEQKYQSNQGRPRSD